jgi:hypothetical protein
MYECWDVICQNRLIYTVEGSSHSSGVAAFAFACGVEVGGVIVVDGCSVWLPNFEWSMFATQQLINFEILQPGMKFS